METAKETKKGAAERTAPFPFQAVSGDQAESLAAMRATAAP